LVGGGVLCDSECYGYSESKTSFLRQEATFET
jgi:hypothetical protein